jgi:hypothetical protein
MGFKIPGPKQYEEWQELLAVRPDLAPALTREEETELSVCPVTDGVSRRMALKMLGNAVVPHQVFPILQEIANHEQKSGIGPSVDLSRLVLTWRSGSEN